MSKKISITLEQSVPYKVFLFPECTNFEFIPYPIIFEPHRPDIQYFRIQPLDKVEPGKQKISWIKKEDSEILRF